MAKKKLSKTWTTVTPLSKFLAMALFIALPFVGFYLGVQYQKNITPAYPSTQYIPEQKPALEPAHVQSVTINPMPQQQQLCTQEAKLCPDGSSVGRTGPHCEFATCPH